jgi:hypothetical protein
MLGKTRIESAPDGRRPISLAVKRAGEPSAGNRHARFEVAGAGNQFRTYGVMAPVLIVDPETKLWIRIEEVLEGHSSGVSTGFSPLKTFARSFV